MFSWRVTKYNPVYRDTSGVYLKDEWYLYAQIGERFEGQLFTHEDYQKAENAYIQAILFFMDCLKINSFQITSLEKTARKKRGLNDPLMKAVFSALKNKQLVSRFFVPIIMQLILRDFLWCKFENEEMYVHFAWDYYMFVGCKKICGEVLLKIEELGLFVEPFVDDDS